jgi:acyl carrier protein
MRIRRRRLVKHVDVAEAKVREWCVNCLARMLKRPARRIDPNEKFTRLGMDSAMSVFFLVELEEWLGLELNPDLVFEYRNVAELARYVATNFPVKAASDAG